MDDVAYYDSQLQYQKRVGEIEKERLQLEREMFSMMRSDKKLQNLRAAKLRSYWQQVCEREKKAKERNEDLLRDFEQLEIRLSAMEAKTNKLKKMKTEYDEKVKRMYPKWCQEVEIARAKKQLKDRGVGIKQQKPQVTHHHHQIAQETTSPVRAHPAPQQNSPPEKQASRSKTPDVTSLFSASVSMPTSAKTPVTSTPKSIQAASSLSESASMQPPDAFADTAPQEVPENTRTSSNQSPKGTTNLVHTIPTAISSDEGNSDFSDTSLLSDKPVKPAVGVVSTGPHKSASVHSSPHQKSFEAVSKHTTTSPTTSHIFHTGDGNSQQAGHANPTSPGNRPASSAMSNVSPVRGPHAASPVTAVSKQRDETQSPEPRPESKLSISSFGSDDLSPRSNASPRSNTGQKSNQPLTANAAYQALLKQHSGTNVKSLEIPEMGEESDEDDLENLLSPHGTQKHINMDSESDEEETFSDRKQSSSPVYVPTAMSSLHSNQARQQAKPRDVPKAPWETDSEDEFGNENTNLSNTGGSSMWDSKLKKYDPQDDFDFYD